MIARLVGGPGRRLGLAVGALVVVAVVGLIVVITLGGQRPTAGPLPSRTALASTSSSPLASSPSSTIPSSSPSENAPPDAPFAARVLVDGLRVRESAGTSAKLVSTLDTGDIVFLQGDHKVVAGVAWYSIQGKKNVFGWVAQGSASKPYIQLLRRVPAQASTDICCFAAGAKGSIAWGGGSSGSYLYASTDGATWSKAQLPTAVHLGRSTAAWGRLAGSSWRRA
jgi:hypothetical protein